MAGGGRKETEVYPGRPPFPVSREWWGQGPREVQGMSTRHAFSLWEASVCPPPPPSPHSHCLTTATTPHSLSPRHHQMHDALTPILDTPRHTTSSPSPRHQRMNNTNELEEKSGREEGRCENEGKGVQVGRKVKRHASQEQCQPHTRDRNEK